VHLVFDPRGVLLLDAFLPERAHRLLPLLADVRERADELLRLLRARIIVRHHVGVGIFVVVR